MEDEQREQEEQGEGGFSIELAKSYLAFGARAVRARLKLSIAIVLSGLLLTIAVNKLFPRTFRCTTILMSVRNPVLDGDRDSSAFSGAHGLIMRRENLETIVRETALLRKSRERLPPLLKFKDSVRAWLSGPMDDKASIDILVGTLESRLSAGTDQDNNLNISADWTDAVTSAELAGAAKDSFLRARHTLEISAFEDKMSILDAHATKLRAEIDGLAQSMRAAADAKAAQVTKSVAPRATVGADTGVRVVRSAARPAALDTDLPAAKEKLVALKAKLDATENERKNRMRDEQAKLDELKLKFTPSHPQVLTQEERVSMASQVPSELAMMRADVADLEGQLKQREALQRAAPAGGGGMSVRSGSGSGAPQAAELPPEIMSLLGRTDDDSDPALTAQISGAIVRYGAIRDDVRAGKIALDTAQAAFHHRYQVIVPVEAPNAPIKPKAALVLGAGLLLSLLLGALVPVLLLLRSGKLVEYWQVHQFQLPVLAQLRLPPR